MLHKHLSFVVPDIKSIKHALLKGCHWEVGLQGLPLLQSKASYSADKICTGSSGNEMVLLGSAMVVQFG